MKPIQEMFDLHRARSGLFVDYRRGDVPYIGNGLVDNAVTGLVVPKKGDKIFRFRGICISAFCEATVQTPPYVACGRAGNGLVVLEPKSPMPVAQLAYIASYINVAVRWRFSWYRQTTADRLKHLTVPDNYPVDIAFRVRDVLPVPSLLQRSKWKFRLRNFVIGDLYDLNPGDYHSLSDLAPGPIPVVSCGNANNGISGYFDIRDGLYRNRLTIAFNGMNTLTAKYHPYNFSAKDDVAVCVPRKPLRVTTELFIQMMLNRERWRYSYYRKCFQDKLRRFVVSLPAKHGDIDEDTMQAIVEASPYFRFVREGVA